MARRYANQFESVMQGYKFGAQAVRDYQDASTRAEIAAVDTDFAPRETPAVSGEDAYAAGQTAYDNAMAGATTDEQRAEVARQYQPTLQALQDQRTTPASVVHSMGVGGAFQQRDTQFSPGEVESAKVRARAAVYQNAGREEDAARVLSNASRSRALADQDELRASLATPGRTPAQAPGGAGMDELTGGDAQPITANTPAGVARGGVPGFRDGLDYYLKEAAPKAIQTLVKQGHIEEAKRYSDFLENRQGQEYARLYMTGVKRFGAGDHAGALDAFEKLYNDDMFPDGNRVKLTALEGDQMRIDQLDAKGKVLGSKTGKMSDLTEQAALALNPLQAVKFIAEQQARRKTEGALLDRQVQLEGIRQTGREAQENRRDERLNTRLDAQSAQLDKRLGAQSSQLDRRLQAQADRGLTAAQDRSNAEIDAAREAISGLSQQDIMRKTAKATNTGRENPEYDPGLARQAALANRRKIGDDEAFDARGQKQAEAAPALDRADIAKRFRADRAMNSRTLGKETQHGVEVLERGKLVGYFR